jgi:hypothetical protein
MTTQLCHFTNKQAEFQPEQQQQQQQQTQTQMQQQQQQNHSQYGLGIHIENDQRSSDREVSRRGSEGREESEGNEGAKAKKNEKINIETSVTDESGKKWKFFHTLRPVIEEVREETLLLIDGLWKSYIDHKDSVRLRTEMINIILDPKTLAKKRLTVYLTEYFVALGFHDIIRTNKVLMAILKGCIAMDKEVKKINFKYYTIRGLAHGCLPDQRSKDLVSKMRDLFSFDENKMEMTKLINEIDPHSSEEVPMFATATATKTTNTTATKRTNTKPERSYYSGQSRFEGGNIAEELAEMRITVNMCLEKINTSINTGENIDASWINARTKKVNVNVWIKALFSIHRADLIEECFKKFGKSRSEKKEIIESNLETIVEGVKLGVATDIAFANSITGWLIVNLPYHPLGGFDKKHFPICQKLQEIVDDKEQFINNKRNIAMEMIETMKMTNAGRKDRDENNKQINYLKQIIKPILVDFYSQTLNYGPLGFAGLHQHVYQNCSKEYTTEIYKLVDTVSTFSPMVKSFVMQYCANATPQENEFKSKPDFFSKFISVLSQKKNEFEKEMADNRYKIFGLVQKLKTTQNTANNRENDDLQAKNKEIAILKKENDDLQAKINLFSSVLENMENEILPFCVVYVDRILTDSQIDFSDLKLNFLLKIISCIGQSLTNSEIKNVFDARYIALCKENITRLNSKNARTIEFLGLEFSSLCANVSGNIFGLQMSEIDSIKINFVSAFLSDIAHQLAINIETVETVETVETAENANDENAIDEDAEFEAGIKDELYSGLLNYIRFDIKETVNNFNAVMDKPEIDRDMDSLFVMEQSLRDYFYAKGHLLQILKKIPNYVQKIKTIETFLFDVILRAMNEHNKEIILSTLSKIPSFDMTQTKRPEVQVLFAEIEKRKKLVSKNKPVAEKKPISEKLLLPALF